MYASIQTRFRDERLYTHGKDGTAVVGESDSAFLAASVFSGREGMDMTIPMYSGEIPYVTTE